MDIKSLLNLNKKSPDKLRTVEQKESGGLLNLFRPTIKYEVGDDEEVIFDTYEVKPEDEMRIDLIFQKCYDLLPTDVGNYLENIDVLLALNNIDNPLNIQAGMIIKYPELGSFDSFRFEEDEESKAKKKSLAQKLGKPNKKTKVDPSRKKFKENDFSLPPTVNPKPKAPVTVEGNKIKIGGL
jgi:hypothetical protein